MTRALPALVTMALVGCSPTSSPQPVKGRTTLQPNATYFWQVKRSTVEWGTCSDAMDFRANVEPLPFSANSFLIYKTNAETPATKATAQTCTSLDPATCKPSSSKLEFDVAGTDLTVAIPSDAQPLRVRDQTGAERDSACKMRQSEAWTIHDNGTTFDLEVTNTLSLEDTTPPSGECDLIEQSLISRSPNMAGIRGCVILFRLGGDLR